MALLLQRLMMLKDKTIHNGAFAAGKGSAELIPASHRFRAAAADQIIHIFYMKWIFRRSGNKDYIYDSQRLSIRLAQPD